MTTLAVPLLHARRTGTILEQAPPPLTLSQGYEIAEELASGLGEQVGWKVGATSPGAQQALGVAEPIYGRVFATGLWQDGAQVELVGDRAAEAEPEIFLRVGRDPGATLQVGDIAEVRLGLEINRPSHPEAIRLGATFIVADNAAHVGLVIGPEISFDLLADPAAVTVRLLRNGELASQGTAEAVLGNPIGSAEWLVALRAGTTRPLRAGDWIATGAMCRSCGFERGDEVVADFGDLGQVQVRRA
jgi:2-keto-4-pentenoate hydratase